MGQHEVWGFTPAAMSHLLHTPRKADTADGPGDCGQCAAPSEVPVWFVGADSQQLRLSWGSSGGPVPSPQVTAVPSTGRGEGFLEGEMGRRQADPGLSTGDRGVPGLPAVAILVLFHVLLLRSKLSAWSMWSDSVDVAEVHGA